MLSSGLWILGVCGTLNLHAGTCTHENKSFKNIALLFIVLHTTYLHLCDSKVEFLFLSYVKM